MIERYACSCCGYLTLFEAPPGTHAICPVCFWENDSVQLADPEFAGGANRASLREARNNYQRIGASDGEFKDQVRTPLPEESPTPLPGS